MTRDEARDIAIEYVTIFQEDLDPDCNEEEFYKSCMEMLLGTLVEILMNCDPYFLARDMLLGTIKQALEQSETRQ